MAKVEYQMRDCEQCKRDGTLERALEREAHMAVLEAQRIMRHC